MQQRLDVLHEVELLVGGGGPEIVALDDVASRWLTLPSSPTIVVLALLAEGRIGEHQVEALAGVGGQRVGHLDGLAFSWLPMPCSSRFIAHSRAVACTSSQPVKVSSFSALLLVPGEVRVVLDDVVVRRQQKAAGAAGRVADGLAGLRGHHVHHGLDQRARGEVLAGAGLGVLGVLLQQALVGVALHVGAHRRPSFPCRSGRRSAAAAWPGPGTCSAPC